MLATVILVIVLLTPGCTSNTGNQTPSAGGSTTPSASSIITYNGANFTIQYPSDWTHSSNTLSVTEIFSAWPPKATNTTNATLLVTSSNVLEPSLSEWTAGWLKALQNQSNFTQIDAGNATLAGYPAYKIVYTFTGPYGDSKVTEIWTVKDGNVYEIWYSAYPKYYDIYADTAQKMIDSFQIK